MSEKQLTDMEKLLKDMMKVAGFSPIEAYSKNIPIVFNCDERYTVLEKYDSIGHYWDFPKLTQKGESRVASLQHNATKRLYEYSVKNLPDNGNNYIFYGKVGKNYELRIFDDDLLASVSVAYNESEMDIGDRVVNGKQLKESWKSAKGFRPMITLTMKTFLARNMEKVDYMVRLLDEFSMLYAFDVNRGFFTEEMGKTADDKKETIVRKILEEGGSQETQNWMSEHFPDISRKLAREEFCKS